MQRPDPHNPPAGRQEGRLLRVLLDWAAKAISAVRLAVGRLIECIREDGRLVEFGHRVGRQPGRLAYGLNPRTWWPKDVLTQPRARMAPRVLMTWALLGVAVALLIGKGVVQFIFSHGGLSDLAMSIAIAGLVSSAVMNARASGVEAERRHSEAESFSRIMGALSRSVSPDAVVEAIVHELGAATGADHVAVVRLRPGSSVLDVTFVSMLPGATTSNSVMPLRQLEPIEARHLRELPKNQGRAPLRILDSEPTSVWRDAYDRQVDPAAAADEATAHFRRSINRNASTDPIQGEPRASEVADRIAYRLRYVYGLRNTLAAPLQSGRSIAGAIVLSRRTGDVWPEAAIRLLNSAAFEASAALERVYSHQAAESEARTDQLTQLPNRRYFDEYCRLLASRRRLTDRVSILTIDVDHFKLFNDQYGHQVGDIVLRSIANAIQLSVREEDVPVRYGGEEFLVLLRNPTPGIALEIGERIRANVRELDLSEHGVTDRLTVSIGVATGHYAGETIPEIVERADRALYAAKRTGRDRVVEAWTSDVAQ
ncbi:MAG TPA: sensor domain-containing diguanylate cyclase [Candidatus Limnocylindrales bacterium]